MGISKAELYNSIYSRLKESSSPEYAVRGKGILNSGHPLLGVKVPILREIASEFKANTRGIFDFDDICRFSSRMWRGKYHEQRKLALHILERYSRYYDDDFFRMLDEWIDDADAWDLIDHISVSIAGKMLVRDLSKIDELIKWTSSDNFWRRRAAAASCVALVHGKYNYYKEALKVSERLMNDREIMVQKAVAWLLREISRKAPDAVYELLLKHKRGVPRFILRESSKKLSDLQKMELLVK